MNELNLRQLRDEDVSLFKKWLYLPHVSKWYHSPLDWIDEVEKRQSDFMWLHHYIVEYVREPIGFCQYYEYFNSGETWHGNIPIDGTYSIDYMIGEVDYLKKGFGKTLINELISKVKLNLNAKRIIVQPDSENIASCSTLLSCNFRFDEDNKIYLMNL